MPSTDSARLQSTASSFSLRLQPDLDQRACSENRYASAPGSSDYRYNFNGSRIRIRQADG